MAAEAYDWRFFLGAGVGLFLAGQVLEFAGVPPGSPAYDLPVAAFLAALGVLCLRNWRACGARHCLVTGAGYLLLAAGALLVAAGTAAVGMDAVWLGFGLVVVVGIAISLMDEPEPEAGR